MGATRERKAMATVVGIPKEIKDMEGRVSMQPDGVAELVHHGHDVYVQAGAGEGAGFSDEEYEEGGARLADGPDEVFESSDLIVKVKEPVPEEYDRFREGHQLFTYLHLAADKGLTEFLMERRINSIAYETVEASDGSLPLLTPMSEVAGRMSVQAAAHHLESPQGGAGLLLGGVPGTPAAKVTIIGGGVVGTEAAKIALGMRALVSVLDISPKRLAYLSDIFEGRADLAIDQGGCIETARPTTHSEPTFVEEGVVHYCVANIPGAVARTSTLALTSVTLPYLVEIADNGVKGAAQKDSVLAKGLSTLDGHLVSEPVAEAHGLSYES